MKDSRSIGFNTCAILSEYQIASHFRMDDLPLHNLLYRENVRWIMMTTSLLLFRTCSWQLSQGCTYMYKSFLSRGKPGPKNNFLEFFVLQTRSLVSFSLASRCCQFLNDPETTYCCTIFLNAHGDFSNENPIQGCHWMHVSKSH